MSPARAKPERLDSLTALRFFAAMYVVLAHSGSGYLAARGAPSWIADLTGRGMVAVSFFYVLSGFVLGYTYLRTPMEAPSSWKRFWVARFARIYPVYILSLLLNIPFYFPRFRGKALRDSLLVLTMTQAWLPDAANAWNLFAWSLSVEAFFYLCFPFLAGYVYRLRPGALWRAAWILWTLTLIPTAVLSFQKDLTIQRALTTNPLIRIPEFLIGVCLGKLFLDELSGSRFMTNRIPSPIVALLLVPIVLAMPWGRAFPLAQSGLLIPLFTWIIYGMARSRDLVSYWFSLPWLVVLGDASYSIYILQSPVREWARVGFANVTALQKLDAIVAIAALVVLSVISFYWVEVPSRDAIKRAFSRVQPREMKSRVFVQT